MDREMEQYQIDRLESSRYLAQELEQWKFTAPNWLNESEYPDHKDIDDLQFWAWQFLRRNKNYHFIWLQYVEALNAVIRRLPELKPILRGRTVANSVCDDYTNEAEKANYWRLDAIASQQRELNVFSGIGLLHDETTVNEWRERLSASGEIQNASVESLESYLGEKWGLTCLTNPNYSELTGRSNFTTCGIWHRYAWNDPSHRYKKYLTDPVYDLRLPVDVLKRQFENVLKEKKEREKKGLFVSVKVRPVLPKYRDYLRVLDALECGLTHEEIAKKLQPKIDIALAKKNVTAWKKAAKKLVEKDYLDLPAHMILKKSSTHS
ncbi:hypothetical protein [Undibacterium sp. Xuan67W]|uniref:hypothetical protein n=1 Tax=Undibacterium sp. Xuan67W TaxID=3413057 RepID=UPI003BF0D708